MVLRLGSRRLRQRTEYADAVPFMIILHEELVAVHYVFGEVPRERLIKKPSSDAEDGRNNAGWKVRPNSSLYRS